MMTDPSPGPSAPKQLRWLGIAFIVLGALAILVPQVATLAIELFIAWGFLFWGALGLVLSLSLRHQRGGWQMAIIFGLIALLGLVLLVRPMAGVVTLTMILIALLVLEGIFSVAMGLAMRGTVPGWGWALASGAMSLIFAALVLAGWPGTATWLLGLLAGVNFLSTGIAALALSRNLGGGGSA